MKADRPKVGDPVVLLARGPVDLWHRSTPFGETPTKTARVPEGSRFYVMQVSVDGDVLLQYGQDPEWSTRTSISNLSVDYAALCYEHREQVTNLEADNLALVQHLQQAVVDMEWLLGGWAADHDDALPTANEVINKYVALLQGPPPGKPLEERLDALQNGVRLLLSLHDASQRKHGDVVDEGTLTQLAALRQLVGLDGPTA